VPDDVKVADRINLTAHVDASGNGDAARVNADEDANCAADPKSKRRLRPVGRLFGVESVSRVTQIQRLKCLYTVT
jgi:hypothetical protein